MAVSIVRLPFRRSRRLGADAVATCQYSILSCLPLSSVPCRVGPGNNSSGRQTIHITSSSYSSIHHLSARRLLPPPQFKNGTRNDSNNAHAAVEIVFDTRLICSSKPFPPWLSSEMRSNHAGETGAVRIYEGALIALDLRRALRLPLYSNGLRGDRYEEDLREFAECHKRSEQGHLDLLEDVLDEGERSVMLPAWRAAGTGLGFVSAFFCPRGMYLTTEAVETFVEEHYGHQIRRLSGVVAGGNMTSNDGECGLKATEELLRMLRHCCEDEVEHKDEARERAAEGPLPWFQWVDDSWQFLVGAGSGLAAGIAKKM